MNSAAFGAGYLISNSQFIPQISFKEWKFTSANIVKKNIFYVFKDVVRPNIKKWAPFTSTFETSVLFIKTLKLPNPGDIVPYTEN